MKKEVITVIPLERVKGGLEIEIKNNNLVISAKVNELEEEIVSKASQIKVFLTDSDGVLTDGGMFYSEQGDELKKFNTKDGMGMHMLKKRGIIVGIITGEDRQLVKNRAEKMGVDELHMGILNKMEILERIKEKYGVSAEQICFVGDDINDLEVIKAVGLGCSVADGMEIVKSNADYITDRKGGAGAVREVAELVLQAKQALN
ncbi:MAG: HAD hydrolase family protein [Halanaerobiales bacterium]|nr:HAD hydrolase family protein [Halanaerobiales bacterium]